MAEWLQSRGLAVEAYTGQTGERREELEQSLLDNRVKALVATTALGMGIALLSLESPAPIVKDGPRWQLTAASLGDEFWERADRLTRLRREEQRQMQEYVRLKAGWIRAGR